jgi:hypothetical protein
MQASIAERPVAALADTASERFVATATSEQAAHLEADKAIRD